jgi:hypothetical protein
MMLICSTCRGNTWASARHAAGGERLCSSCSTGVQSRGWGLVEGGDVAFLFIFLMCLTLTTLRTPA